MPCKGAIVCKQPSDCGGSTACLLVRSSEVFALAG